MNQAFAAHGWALFPPEAATRHWAERALHETRSALRDPDLAHLHVCEGTWFVGLEALPNDADGGLAGAPPLDGAAVAFLRDGPGWPALHRAQLSVTFPGYPRPRAGETAAAFRYRRDRDAAHVDGVIGKGTPKRRFVEEPHAFIFGIGLSCPDVAAAPLAVYDGSHRIMRDAFRAALKDVSSEDMVRIDVTDAYIAARRRCFETCRRREMPLEAGAVVVLHPMLLHGVAPWRAGNGIRATAYFRPPAEAGVAGWLAC